MASRKKTNEVTELTEEQVWDVIKYAQLASGGNLFPGVFSPFLVNQRMQDATLNPLATDESKIAAALADPKNHETELQGYSETFELQSMIYKRMMHYLSNLLSFDLTYVCTNTTSEKDYKSPAYQKDLKVIHDFLDRFDVRKEFKLVMKQLLRQEAFFCVLRDDGEKYTLQELPSSRSKITGRWEHGLLMSFDMYWFLQPGVDINMYPEVFKKMFNEAFNSGGGKYNPASTINLRGDSSWVMWVDCSPKDNFWTWKFTPEIATRVPYLSSLFPDIVLQPMIRSLQKNLYIISASKILMGQIPLLKENKGGSVANQFAIDHDKLGKFMGLIRAGLSDAIKVASAPLENMQAISFPLEDKSMYEGYLKTTSASSGINSRLIFSSNDKPNAIETQLSVDTDEFLVNYIYPYFNSFLEYHINQRTKKYKFKFAFEGSEFSLSRERRMSTQTSLCEKGIVLPQKIAAAMGMQYHDFIRQLEEGRASEFVDKLTPIMSSFQMSGDEKTGRPTKKSSELSDEGAETRANAGNVGRGGKST